MRVFRPKFVTFDCYGTLTQFDIAGSARRIYADTLTAEAMDRFIPQFSAYRLDEILGAWKPYGDVIANALERTCKANAQ